MYIRLIYALSLMLGFLPVAMFAQVPNPGTAARFALFTTNGAVGNTSRSQITGDIGTNLGAVTGFGNVDGVMHVPADSATSLAAADLTLLANEIDSTVTTGTLLPALGGGDTLSAGVYTISGITTLDSTLILDAHGNAAAVFIIRISAAFSTNAGARIILEGSANANNVFWKVEGAVNMATNTIMRGTIIADHDAITMGADVTLEGRALSIGGAINVDQVLAYIPFVAPLSGPLAPTLASAGCYTMFSASGPVANSGVTNVTGDVGTNVGLTTGFDSVHVNGAIHPAPDTSTAHSKSDLLAAYNYLNNLPVDIQLLYPADFGHSQVLTPQTYLLGAATTLTDTLNLDAQGNSAAVFVIKINGELNTGVRARVILQNGALAGNVYWKVDGAVSINDYSDIKGTIISHNGAISMDTGVNLDGRALTTSGAFSTVSVTATMPPTGCSPYMGAPLPVTWLYFNGVAQGQHVLLQWGTTVDMNNEFFTIDKSVDGKSFQPMATVASVHKDGQPLFNYSFTDQQPYALTYYRISETDYSGQRHYFNTIQIAFTNAIAIGHYIDGADICVRIAGTSTGMGTLVLYGIDGKKIAEQSIALLSTGGLYRVASPSVPGIYLLYLTCNGQYIYHGKVVVD